MFPLYLFVLAWTTSLKNISVYFEALPTEKTSIPSVECQNEEHNHSDTVSSNPRLLEQPSPLAIIC